MHVGTFLAEKIKSVLPVGNKPQPNIGATLGEGLLHEIDIGGVILHQEYFFHYGAPSCSSRRVHATGKGAYTEGEDVATEVFPMSQNRFPCLILWGATVRAGF